jgi:hypothetical protein
VYYQLCIAVLAVVKVGVVYSWLTGYRRGVFCVR